MGLDVGGKVERVALQLGEGDGRMLQVVQQHLDLKKRGEVLYKSLIDELYSVIYHVNNLTVTTFQLCSPLLDICLQ